MEFSDINSELCMLCGECCKIFLLIDVDERYYRFLKEIGLKVSKSANADNKGMVEIGYCKHLNIDDGMYKCKIYDNRPELCKDYNCLAWARCNNVESKSTALARAREVHSKIIRGESEDVIILNSLCVWLRDKYGESK